MVGLRLHQVINIIFTLTFMSSDENVVVITELSMINATEAIHTVGLGLGLTLALGFLKLSLKNKMLTLHT